jgi:HSP20 family protein
MKNEQIIIAVVVLLVLVLGIQAYSTYQLNDRLKQMLGPVSQSENQSKPPKATKPALPKPDDADDFFKDRSWNPYAELQHMQNEMEQMFGDSFSRFHMHTPIGDLSKSPAVDLQVMPDQYVVTVNVPGADESTMNVTLEDERLLHISVKTEQASEKTDEKNNEYQYRERFMGEFHRLLTLPGAADASKLKTDYRNGVLTITVPKK